MLNRYSSPTPVHHQLFALGGIGGSQVSLPGTPNDSGEPVMFRPALDPITVVVQECIALLLAMRKAHRQSGAVAALLGGAALDLFGDDTEFMNGTRLVQAQTMSSSGPGGDPLTSSFLQLRQILTLATTIYDIDLLTVLQPFLMVIKAPSQLGHITGLALQAVSKFLTFQIISFELKNLQQALIEVVLALCWCRFEQGDQSSDDAVLLKVLRLLEIILESPLLNLLTNESITEVVKVCWSLAINKKRSEVLRRAAEMAMEAMTFRIFSRLAQIEVSAASNDEDLPVNFDPSTLPKDTIGAGVAEGQPDTAAAAGVPEVTPPAVDTTLAEEHPLPSKDDVEKGKKPNDQPTQEEPFGIVAINDFLGILTLMIAPSLQYTNMELTRVFALLLITTAIEVAGKDVARHPALLLVVADPVNKNALRIITTTELPVLLRAAMQLFTTMAIVMGQFLKPQLELALLLIIESIVAAPLATDSRGARLQVRLGVAKEILTELLLLLWTRRPRDFFVNLFVNYDCDFEKSDLAVRVVHHLCDLALPESAAITTDNVPPICLEGVLLLVSGLSTRVVRAPIPPPAPMPRLIADRQKKTSFVSCAELFNKKPAAGLEALAKHGFISEAKDNNEVARFFFNKLGRLNKKVLGEFLAKPSNKDLLIAFIGLFDFYNMRVDEAIRILLKTFRLPGESQQIERIVELFAERYVECLGEESENVDTTGVSEVNDEDVKNVESGDSSDSAADGDKKQQEHVQEQVRPDRDTVFILSYSIIMLNTDLHNPQVKKQMLLSDYQRNLKGVYNGRDFPEWYLAKIYQSIKDREIIMPEEHHGTDKWFDDEWNNLVQAETVSVSVDVTTALAADQAQFDCHLFSAVSSKLFETLFAVFADASDDQVITRVMLCVDKCATICTAYQLDMEYHALVEALANCTNLVDGVPRLVRDVNDDDLREVIPLTQITVDEGKQGTKTVTVGLLAVWFGRDFKGQILTVVLFRLLKKVQYHLDPKLPTSRLILRIVLLLFENCLVDASLLGSSNDGPAVKPRYIIAKVKPVAASLGILLSFSSFLKGYGTDSQPEPTDAEIDATMSTLDCISLLNLAAVVSEFVSPRRRGEAVDLLLDLLPAASESTKRFYEAETVLLLDLATRAAGSDPQRVASVLELMASMKQMGKLAAFKLLELKLDLVLKLGTKSIDTLTNTLSEIAGTDKEFLSKQGSGVLKAILKTLPAAVPETLHYEGYWKVLRVYGLLQNFAYQILDFIEHLTRNDAAVNSKNFMYILGLLDEISSMGALGAAHEQRADRNGEKVENVEEVVAHAKRSICLTADLAPITKRADFVNLRYLLLQALAHQCFNPCREVRLFSLGVLRSTILATELDEQPTGTLGEVTAFGLFEYGLFPLLAELTKPEVIETDPTGFVATQIEALNLVSKVFLQHCTLFTADTVEQVWCYILDSFVKVKLLMKPNQIKPFDEAAPEMIKNMVLVLQSNSVLSERLAGVTWDKVDKIYPELQKEVQLSKAEKTLTEPGQQNSVNE